MSEYLTALFFATFVECELILEKLKNYEKITIFENIFFKGKINKLSLLLCLSGVGKINSAISATLAFEKFNIKRAIISGIAGAYPSSGLEVGDIAAAEKEIDADKGLLINCEDKEDSFIFINSDEIILQVPDFLKQLKRGTFLTVSACTGNLSRAKFFEKRFKAICENMEGAAVAKVAQIYGIPVSEIRSISNIVTDRNELLKIDDVKKNALIIQDFMLENLPLIVESL